MLEEGELLSAALPSLALGEIAEEACRP